MSNGPGPKAAKAKRDAEARAKREADEKKLPRRRLPDCEEASRCDSVSSLEASRD